MDRLPLKDKLQPVPTKPGVYLMKDRQGEVIYVGKAINLRNRVRSYFHASAEHSPKLRRMVDKITDLDFIVTDSEIEAALVDAVSAYQFIAAEGDVQAIGDPLTDELYVIAVQLDSPLLLKAINEALVDMREDGTLERLQEKWFRVMSN